MLYQIINGSIELGGNTILKNICFEIRRNSKTAIIGRNGAGKTTLLRAINNELNIFGENHDIPCVNIKNDIRIGYLKQIAFDDDTLTLEQEVKRAFSRYTEIKEKLDILLKSMQQSSSQSAAEEYAELESYFRNIGGYYYEKEYETVVNSFGFSESDRQKRLNEFSGGQRTKIAFARLLLSKPDVLLLDEPTNHLDMSAVEWLEGYLKNYPGAIVLVSHDRMFLDRIVSTVYEAEYATLTKYNGNYSDYVIQKKERFEKAKREYEAQQKEIARLSELVDRFKYKPTKAAMAASKLKAIERMPVITPPARFDLKAFYSDTTPLNESAGTVLTVLNLGIGYNKLLSTVEFEMKRGRKIGIIGGNGLGKSTFLKTILGEVKALSGSFRLGAGVTIGYFDQQMAQYKSKKTVLEDYSDTFPRLTQTQCRTSLGAFLFRKDDVFKKISVLSGGERVRLALCKIFNKRPNLLLLDEPTNHMDIVGVDALEAMLKEYSGSLLCVSHDRMFLRNIADSLLIFEDDKVTYYPYSYATYIESSLKPTNQPSSVIKSESKESKPKTVKGFTTPLKELDKKKKRLSKIEKTLEENERRLNELNALSNEKEIMSDYERLIKINEEIQTLEELTLELMEEYETLENELKEL